MQPGRRCGGVLPVKPTAAHAGRHGGGLRHPRGCFAHLDTVRPLERKSPASIHLTCIGESTHATLVAHPSHVRIDDHVDRHVADPFSSRPTTLLPTAIEHARYWRR